MLLARAGRSNAACGTARRAVRAPSARRTHAAVVASLLCGAVAAACSTDGGGRRPAVAADGGPSPSGEAPPGEADADASARSRPRRPPAFEARPYRHFDVNHVLVTGQSNAVGNSATPVLTKSQPYANLSFDSGVLTARSCDGDGCRVFDAPGGFVPLVEGDTYFGYPVETPSSGLANEVSLLASHRGLDAAHAVLVSVHARSGNPYSCLRKGSCRRFDGRGYVSPFESGMREVDDAAAIARAAGKSYAVRAVATVHGEADHYMYTDGAVEYPLAATDGEGTVADYSEALLEWQRDYESAIRARTGQTLPVPLLVSQYSHWNDVPHSEQPFRQMRAHLRAPGKVVLIGPTYALPYSRDCLHFTNHGERWLGEYFGKVYTRVVLEGRAWEPLRPRKLRRSGNVVTAEFFVPVPPLVLDTQRVSDPGSRGFEWFDDSAAPPSIAEVTVTGPETVTITLSAPPTGANGRLRYAYTYHGCPGPQTGARGNLRDSDGAPSNHGYDLFNWAVHFDEPVP